MCNQVKERKHDRVLNRRLSWMQSAFSSYGRDLTKKSSCVDVLEVVIILCIHIY